MIEDGKHTHDENPRMKLPVGHTSHDHVGDDDGKKEAIANHVQHVSLVFDIRMDETHDGCGSDRKAAEEEPFRGRMLLGKGDETKKDGHDGQDVDVAADL